MTKQTEALAEQPAPSQYGSTELQAMIVARAMEKNAAEQPAQQEPLTDEQIKSMWRRGAIFGTNDEKAIAIARAIEAAHNIKEQS